MGNGSIGKGIILAYAPIVSGTPGTYVAIADLKDLVPPPRSVGTAESTVSEDDSDQFVPGFINNGVAEFEINSTHAQTTALYGMTDGATTYSWKITLPDTHTWVFPGFIENYAPKSPLKQVMTDRIKIRLTSKAVYS